MYFLLSTIYKGESVNQQSGVSPSVLNIGDKVRCTLDLEILKQMQEGHGGWNPRMADVSVWWYSKYLDLLIHQILLNDMA